MSDKIEITAEMIRKANDYVPLAEKEAWVTENAAKCFDRLAITADGEAVPPMYMVNTGLKSRYMMAALAGMYFRTDYQQDPKDEALMSVEDYDRWAGGHVFCQLNRLKRIQDVRDKCYDLMTDFADLEKRFSAQLSALLAVQNDAVIRQSEYTAAQMKDLPNVIAQLKELQEARENGD